MDTDQTTDKPKADGAGSNQGGEGASKPADGKEKVLTQSDFDAIKAELENSKANNHQVIDEKIKLKEKLKAYEADAEKALQEQREKEAKALQEKGNFKDLYDLERTRTKELEDETRKLTGDLESKSGSIAQMQESVNVLVTSQLKQMSDTDRASLEDKPGFKDMTGDQKLNEISWYNQHVVKKAATPGGESAKTGEFKKKHATPWIR